MATILKVALALNLNVLPRKLLPQPFETGLSGHLYHLFPFGRFDLLFQEDVYAERRDAGMGRLL